LRLGIDAGSRFPLLLHKLAEAGQNEFAFLANRFISKARERIQKKHGRSFVRLGRFGQSNLKFSLGHVWRVLSQQSSSISRRPLSLWEEFKRGPLPRNLGAKIAIQYFRFLPDPAKLRKEARWSGVPSGPDIGERVQPSADVGAGTVTAYFVDNGCLGVLVRLQLPEP
jgi:hypothetical protein